MRMRAATAADVAQVVEMADDMRRRLAGWSPAHFAPRQGAAELHAAYLAYLVDADDRDTRVVVDDRDVPVGFVHLVAQPDQTWADDLYVADPDLETEVARLLATAVAAPWVTCVSRFDDRRSAALTAAGLLVVSSYWSRSVAGHRPARAVSTGLLGDPPEEWPRHTFGGQPVDPADPGALVVADEAGGCAIGSPGVEPPLYDPGGPTCVADRIHGSDRAVLLDALMATAADRGDARLLVVCDGADEELAQILTDIDFRAEVDVFARL
ncbi:MAG: hypothetical protein S0880_12145 [Actinomycetota bacterium]|nr:hypothetical protein [Actinomycetota bacterium]